MLCPAFGMSFAFFPFNEEAKLAGRHFQCDAQIPQERPGSTMNEGLVWLVWIPVSVILLVLLVNTFIIV
jgi:hypothetical protein